MENYNVDAPVFVPKFGMPLNPLATEFIPSQTDITLEKESSRFSLNPEAKVFQPPIKLENGKLTNSKVGLNAGATEFQPSKIPGMVTFIQVNAEGKVLTASKGAEEEVKLGEGELDREFCEAGVWQHWRLNYRTGNDKEGRSSDKQSLSVGDIDWFYL